MTYVNHFVSQFAGEIGLISVGLGKEFTKYSLSGLYGVVPSEYSEGPVIETVTLRQTYSLYDWKRIDFYGGLNIYHVLSLQYQSSKFKDAPSEYYPIGSIRGLLYGGIALNMNPRRGSSFYFEAGLNDIWLTNWLSNSKTVNALDHGSLGMGYKLTF